MRLLASLPSQSPFLTYSFQRLVPSPSAFGAEGRLPSVVYISVAPSGMSTLNWNEPVNSLLSALTTGCGRRCVAKVAVALLAPGVGVDVHPHSSLPSAVRA